MTTPEGTARARGSDAGALRGRPDSWRSDIQGLRAVAVGLVIAAHATLPFSDGGFVGVDVFFVISGFLITGLLLREADRTGRISLRDFYARRARRILPAATAVLLALLVYGAFRLPQTKLAETVADAGWSAVFLANWHFAAEGTNYFADDAPSLLQHYWSLAVEEQFYLLWPLLAMLLLPRFGRRLFAVVAGAAFVASLGWSLISTAASPDAAYFSTFARAFELASGALLACIGTGALGRIPRNVLGIGGIALLALATLTFSEDTPFPGWHALVPTLGTVALLAAGPDTVTGRILSLAPLRYLGNISFSLYLWHWPVLVLVPDWFPWGAPRLPQLALAGLLILGLSMASYHLIEVPFQRKRMPLSRGSRALALWPVALALVAVLGVSSTSFSAAQASQREQAAAAWFAQNDPGRSTNAQSVEQQLRGALELADQGAPIPPGLTADSILEGSWRDTHDGCYAGTGSTTAEECVFGDPDSSRVVALVGDSHAAMWLDALDALGKQQGFQVRLFAKISCAHYPVYQPANGMTHEECAAFRGWTIDRLTELQPETVLTTARGYLFVEPADGMPVEQQWSEAVRTSVEQLRTITDDVRVLGDVPAREAPGDCLSAVDASQARCVAEPIGPEVESNDTTRAAAEEAGAAYVDLTPLVCVDGRCPLVVGETPVYEDDSHVSAAWVTHVTPRFAELVGPFAGRGG